MMNTKRLIYWKELKPGDMYFFNHGIKNVMVVLSTPVWNEKKNEYVWRELDTMSSKIETVSAWGGKEANLLWHVIVK